MHRKKHIASVRNYAATERYVCARTESKSGQFLTLTDSKKEVANYEKCKSEKSETNTEARFMKYNEHS